MTSRDSRMPGWLAVNKGEIKDGSAIVGMVIQKVGVLWIQKASVGQKCMLSYYQM